MSANQNRSVRCPVIRIAIAALCWAVLFGHDPRDATGAEPPKAQSSGLTKIRLLPPGPGNPRNSEGAFIALKDGRVLFVYTHFTGGGSDHAAAHLAARF